MLKVGVTQLDIAWTDKEENKKRCAELIKEAHDHGVKLLIFPEMTLTGFTMEPEKWAESYAGGRIPDTISFFMKESTKYDMQIAFGFIEASKGKKIETKEAGIKETESENSRAGDSGTDKRIYENKLILVDGGNLVMEYSKIHPFSYSGEDEHYTAGDKLCHTETDGVGIGGYICYDLRFPEIFSAARDENEAVMVIANWPEERVSQWETLLRARAVENQCYVMGVNRTGYGDGKNYVPSSYVFDCYGNDVSKQVSPGLKIADIDVLQVRSYRKSFPQSLDRKNNLYVKMYK